MHRLRGYAEVEQWWLSDAPNCVGLEGLSESSVMSPVSDSGYAYTLAGLDPESSAGDDISMRFVGEQGETSPRGEVKAFSLVKDK